VDRSEMAAFSDADLLDKLHRLNSTQQSIQTLSHWIMCHRRNAFRIVELWSQELQKGNFDQKLTLLYLANDVLQSSRKKGPEFVREFLKFLKPAIISAHSSAPVAVQKSIGRLLDIWEDRQVLPEDFITDVRSAASIVRQTPPLAAAVPATATESAAAHSNEVKSIDSSLATVLRSISQAEAAAPLIEVLAGKVAALPVTNERRSLIESCDVERLPMVAAELEESLAALETFKKQLEEDLERRTRIVESLSAMIEENERFLKTNTAHLQNCLDQLEAVEEQREKVKTLLSSSSSMIGKRAADQTEDESSKRAKTATFDQPMPMPPPHLPLPTPLPMGMPLPMGVPLIPPPYGIDPKTFEAMLVAAQHLIPAAGQVPLPQTMPPHMAPPAGYPPLPFPPPQAFGGTMPPHSQR